jgi:DNA-binding GntR family transcriptional regulator
MSKLIKATLADQAYQELRSRIVSGRLAGGTRLLPNELANDLGISPTPVKEACARLEADGLVVASSRRGMVVRRFSAPDIEQLYDARWLIERGAAERAFINGRFTDELVARLEESLEQHRRHARWKTLDELSLALAYDRKFHQLLVGEARIDMVSDWLERILSQTHTVFVSVPGHYEISVEDHEHILDAVKARSLDRVLVAIEQHLANSRSNALFQVRKLDEQLVSSE